MLGSGIAIWQICCTTSFRIVVSLSVGGVVQHVSSPYVRVVEFGTKLAGACQFCAISVPYRNVCSLCIFTSCVQFCRAKSNGKQTKLRECDLGCGWSRVPAATTRVRSRSVTSTSCRRALSTAASRVSATPYAASTTNCVGDRYPVGLFFIQSARAGPVRGPQLFRPARLIFRPDSASPVSPTSHQPRFCYNDRQSRVPTWERTNTMTEIYKILAGLYDNTVTPNIPILCESRTRGNSLKIVNRCCHYDLRKYSFLEWNHKCME